ncbi:hypothetical protein SCLCIDRAFT_24490 [Scleroderma citrinum Foug A]|uniref:MARVEL domain-containing protein n=1 Tax=Scleroderma citrinum Foug A TaxID=1036808 RepID=A0A0C3DR47_9AGAM|nr:hypothetical protein SCLCIDRAFT_24490 [Scleroderma citrinum Foug A]
MLFTPYAQEVVTPNMTNHLLIGRYILFCLFVICNAMICISAAWNHSLAFSNQIFDVYLAFLGAFALVFIFTLVFVELLTKHPFTTRIWFECTWIVLFWLMELAGATAATLLLNNEQCSFQGVVSFQSLCTSVHFLVAFTWICTGILLVYLVLLICTTIVYQQDNPDIWNSTVRRLCWSVGRQSLCTPPCLPIMSRKHTNPLPGVTYAPQPVRPIPRPVYINHSQAGLGSEYEIERYKSPQNQGMPVLEQMDVEAKDSLPEAAPIPLSGQAHVLAAQRLPQPPRPRPSPSRPPPAVMRPSAAPLHPVYDSFTAVRELLSRYRALANVKASMNVTSAPRRGNG